MLCVVRSVFLFVCLFVCLARGYPTFGMPERLIVEAAGENITLEEERLAKFCSILCCMGDYAW